MNKIIKAKPTAYKGIRFRSKTEASLAVAFDYYEAISEWRYEPFQYKLDEWLPDFEIVLKDGFKERLLIECKPRNPNIHYHVWLQGQSEKVLHEYCHFATVIICINSYLSEHIILPVPQINKYSYLASEYIRDVFKNFNEAVEASNHYRFDLEYNP